MASPVGHTLAGYLGYRLIPLRFSQPLSQKWAWGAVVLANLPDLDFLPGLLIGDAFAFHRRESHTLIAAIAVGSLVALGVRSARRWQPPTAQHLPLRGLWWGLWAVAVYLGHLCLDLLMVDPKPPFGLQLFWPFSDAFVVSPIAIIPGLQFHPVLSWHNLMVVGIEILWLVPLIWAAGAVSSKLKRIQS